jgi:hypothetical protein
MGVAAKDTPGNNGTVKIHDGADEPKSETRNEPKVCKFHLHFFFGDDEQSGTWEIQRWAPGPKGQVVLAGTYSTDGDGEDRQPRTGTYSLADGEYKLFWDGDTGKNDKKKVFRVECDQESNSPSNSPSKSPKPSHSASSSPTASASPSKSPKPSRSPKPSHSASPSASSSPTASASSSPSKSPKPSHSASPSASSSPSQSTRPTPSSTASPSGSASPTPDRPGSIVVFKVDNQGTDDDFSDDELLEGARFSLFLDDNDSVFDRGDTLISANDEATGGVVEYNNLADGKYWVVEVVVPDGFIGTEPLLIPVDGDSASCFFDRSGSLGCTSDPADRGTSVVFVDNTPEGQSSPTPSASGSASPTGSSGGETGSPDRTLPPTDTLAGEAQANPESWRLVLIMIAGLLSAILVLTPDRQRR